MDEKGETVTFNIEGSMQADASKLRERAASGARGTRGTRADGKIDIVSGREYEVLEDGNIVITVVLTESAATINSITKTAASATGIEAIDHGTLTIDHYYDLNGHRLQSKPTVPGIYINNGKKVVVK